jgi:2-phospho-L-lactate/phosphoenolpyruvate guanylyltransferase
VQADVLIPLKHLDAAKSRLATALSVAERRRLMAAMVAHVTRTVLAADAGRVVLVSSDPAAPALAGRLGVACVSDADLPWNQGLLHARAHLPAPAEAVLYLAGDLPLLEVGDVAALIGAGGSSTAVVGRAHDGGTNALWICPAAALEPAFGTPRSAAVHAGRAVAHGLGVVVIDRPGLAHDVDTPADLALARRLVHGSAGVI